MSLLQGDFVVHLVRARFTVPITARASVDAFIQRNGLNPQGDPELNSQIRFHLIFARDSNLYIVYSDQRRKRTTGDVAVDQAMQMKMNRLTGESYPWLTPWADVCGAATRLK